MKYSGRTSAHEHKFEPWQDKDVSKVQDCIQQKTIFEVQWSNCPVEVEDEVRQLWGDYGAGNDFYYIKWESEEDGEQYPIIDEYLKSRGITKCLIHWWW